MGAPKDNQYARKPDGTTRVTAVTIPLTLRERGIIETGARDSKESLGAYCRGKLFPGTKGIK